MRYGLTPVKKFRAATSCAISAVRSASGVSRRPGTVNEDTTSVTRYGCAARAGQAYQIAQMLVAKRERDTWELVIRTSRAHDCLQ